MRLPSDVALIALDNGSMCGIAIWLRDRFLSFEADATSTLHILHTCVCTPPNPPLRWFVAAERWDSAGRSSRPMTAQVAAIETNGAARWISSQCNATFGLQSRGEAKKVMSDGTLRRLGWYVRTKDGHANDATRHLGLMLLQHFPVEYMRLIELV